MTVRSDKQATGKLGRSLEFNGLWLVYGDAKFQTLAEEPSELARPIFDMLIADGERHPYTQRRWIVAYFAKLGAQVTVERLGG